MAFRKFRKTVKRILFNIVYEGTPRWDIGHPQREFVQLEDADEIKGSVLDVGCGTGENALYLASRGHEVWGVDFTPRAIEKARDKAARRHLNVTFLVRDVLQLGMFGRDFDTVIDSALFHTLSDEERPLFASSLADVLRRGGAYFMICFSELEPGSYGPRRVKRTDIHETFTRGWHVKYIRPAYWESRRQWHRAWLASITKEGCRKER
ncbi:MAG: class I SAM-dependent methyltransferase [Halobacteriota archaeon]